MGSILHIASQLNPERTHLHPHAVFRLIERSEPVPLGERGERKWAVASAITLVEQDDERDDDDWPPSSPPPGTRSRSPTARRRDHSLVLG
jgi:hypothetical protein